ncbi:unnamed protein product [Sphagnum troendelagicum]
MGGGVELGEGLKLVPCTAIDLAFTRADVTVKAVDEWQLKEALNVLLKKRLGAGMGDMAALVVRSERNLYKKRRDEPIASAELRLWGEGGGGGVGELQKKGGAHVDNVGRLVVDAVNGLELNVGGLKVRCSARIQEVNDFEVVKRSWEAIFGPNPTGMRRTGPTTLVLRGVPSRWFAEPRVSSKPSVLVTHTIFSKFGEIRNLEVMSNGDVSKVGKEVGSMAATLQCIVWVQFENHASFCNAVQSLCGHVMQKEGSSFKAAYVVDWDRENYFSEINIRRRKFEKERLEQQERRLLVEAARRQYSEAQQAKFAHLEKERLEIEQRAKILRDEAEHHQRLQQQQQEADQARMLQDDVDIAGLEDDLIEVGSPERVEKLVRQEQLLHEDSPEQSLEREEESEEDEYREGHMSQLIDPSERWQPEEDLHNLQEWPPRHDEDVYHGVEETGPIEETSPVQETSPIQERHPIKATNPIREIISMGEPSHFEQEDVCEDEGRWELDVTHSVASLSASEMLVEAGLQIYYKISHSGNSSPEKRLQSVVLTAS